MNISFLSWIDPVVDVEINLLSNLGTSTRRPRIVIYNFLNPKINIDMYDLKYE